MLFPSLELRLSGQSGDLTLSKGYLEETEAEVRPAGSEEGTRASLQVSPTQWHLGPWTSGHFSSLMLMAVQPESRCDMQSSHGYQPTTYFPSALVSYLYISIARPCCH